MGLIKAALATFNSTMADQWKEYFICDAINQDTLMVKGHKQTAKRTSNTSGSDDIITNGSMIVVNEGQAMLMVDDGAIVEFTAEPGVFTYDSGTETSIFHGELNKEDLKKGILDSLQTMKRRLGFGGDTGHNTRIYYFNLKELFGQKFGTPEPVPYDDPVYQSINIRFFGQATLRLKDPVLFYKNISGNVADQFKLFDYWNNQLSAEFIMNLSQAMALLANEGVKYNQIPQQQLKLADYMNTVLDDAWVTTRGLLIEHVAISSITLDPEDHQKIQKIDDMRLMSNPLNAAGRMTAATANAIEAAGANTGGAMLGMAGMNMAMGAGMGQVTQLQQMAQQSQQTQQPSTVAHEEPWQCPCGATVTGHFCPQCGLKKPEETTWICPCGAKNSGHFCSQCGAKKPLTEEPQVWTCQCGQTNTGKFCDQCGAAKI